MMIITIALLAFAVFGRSLFGEFLFDDPAISDDEDSLTRPLFTRPVELQRRQRALTTLAYRIAYQISGRRFLPFTFHAMNLAVHAANVVLVYVVLLPLLGPERATMAAAIFAFHPLQASSVCYISALAGMLATLHTLLGLAEFQLGGWHLALAVVSQYFAWRSKPDALFYTPLYLIYGFLLART